MTIALDIRKATASDLSALNGLIEALGYKKEPGYFETCLAEQDEGRRLVFIVSAGGRDVGYGMLNWRPQYALYRRLDIPEIQDLRVLPADRQQGAGSALIEHCESVARAKGCTQIGVSVALHKDFGPAQRLYVKRGYVPDGYGVTYDRASVASGEIRPVDDNLCLMMVKTL